MGLQADQEGFSDVAFSEQGTAPGDERLLVRFFLKPRENPAKSKEAGRPIFEDREYLSIMVPGNKDSIIERPVSELDIRRFPRHYKAFQENREQTVEGTPLSSWPGITRAQVEELKFLNISTVEQLAGIADVHAQNFMGIQRLKTRAKLFMESAGDNAINEKTAAALEEKDARIAALEVQMAEMAEALKEAHAISDSSGDDKQRRSRSRVNTSK